MTALAAEDITLVDLVDRVLNKGVVLTGDVTLSVAGVDLVYVGLRVLLASAGTLDRLERERGSASTRSWTGCAGSRTGSASFASRGSMPSSARRSTATTRCRPPSS